MRLRKISEAEIRIEKTRLNQYRSIPVNLNTEFIEIKMNGGPNDERLRRGKKLF